MKIYSIRKRNGSSRTIYNPDLEERQKIKALMPKIKNAFYRHRDDKNVIHGFMLGKSCITNAARHIGYEFTLCMDIKDFFDSVTYEKVKDLIDLNEKEIEILFPDGAARQGLPSSPMLANLAGIKIDRRILKMLGNRDIVYTRYADDLCFSFKDESLRFVIENAVTVIVSDLGFEINKKKTEFIRSSAGRRNITGVMVDNGIYPSRKHKRRLRAARHQDKKNSIHGLEEWCKLRLPYLERKRLRKVGNKKTELSNLKKFFYPA